MLSTLYYVILDYFFHIVLLQVVIAVLLKTMGHESFRVPKEEAIKVDCDRFDESLYGNDSTVPGGTPEVAGAPPAIERWDSEAEAALYRERNKEILAHLTDLETRINSLHHDETGAMDIDEAELHTMLEQREVLRQEKIKTSANYPGDWTGLLYVRMISDVTKEQFIAQRLDAMQGMLSGEPSDFERKPKQYQPHYQAQIDNYDARINEIFSRTNIGTAADYGKEPRNLGLSNIDLPGTIFNDGIFAGKKLTVRQKNIVESHEKGHGVRDYTSPLDSREIRSVIDGDALQALTASKRLQESRGEKEGRFQSIYVEKPEEIIERMSQFKNYFGMGVGEPFTALHLKYLRENYVKDTELDNGITDLLSCITPKTEAAFLAIINKYPI